MRNYIQRRAGLLVCLGLALAGCASVNGITMSKVARQRLENIAYLRRVPLEQVVNEANTDNNKQVLSRREYEDYTLNYMRGLQEAIRKVFSGEWPTEKDFKPYDPNNPHQYD